MVSEPSSHPAVSSPDYDGLNRPRSIANNDPNKLPAIIVGILFVVTLPILLGIIVAYLPATAGTGSSSGMHAVSMSPGELVYQSGCAVCHGPNADGVPRLGKPLRNNSYVQNNSDDALFRYIVTGRLATDPDNTSGTPMPPRGGKPLSDQQVHSVVRYLRTLQDPTQPFTSLDAWNIKKTTNPADDGTGNPE